MDFEKRCEEMFLDLPEVPKELESFARAAAFGKLLHLSGQLPYSEGRLAFKGRLGLELNLDAGRSAARTAAIQALGALKAELGSLNKIKRIIHVRLFVATGAEFKDHKKVLLGVLELFSDIFGPNAKCSYEVVGSASLPEGAAVELSMIVETK